MLGLGGTFGGLKSIVSHISKPSNSQLNSLRTAAERHYGNPTRNGVRLFTKKWTKGRSRLVHVEYPSRVRSPLAKLDDKNCTLYYVTQGYVNVLNKNKMSDADRAVMQRNRKNPFALRYGGKIPLDKALPLIEKKKQVVLVFSKGFTHELLEAFTMSEVLELEKMLPQIKAAMDKAAKELPKQVEQDRKARQVSLGLTKGTQGAAKVVGKESTVSLLSDDLKLKIMGTVGEVNAI